MKEDGEELAQQVPRECWHLQKPKIDSPTEEELFDVDKVHQHNLKYFRMVQNHLDNFHNDNLQLDDDENVNNKSKVTGLPAKGEKEDNDNQRHKVASYNEDNTPNQVETVD